MSNVTPEDPIITALLSDPAARRMLAAFAAGPLPCIDCGREATRLATVMTPGGISAAPVCEGCYRTGLGQSAALVPGLPVVEYHHESECDGRCDAEGGRR